uniref:dynein heavy chain domain-containing protein 1-like isoform X1 n=2 Tax=Styela clava TaxID=7725 RepID=UPI00193A92C6|nr:dynein heavy chain domain-containing protein 1-like isoform X1 [Styela clava]
MAFYQDNIPFIPSSPKLPAISSGGLVTGPDSFVFKRPSHDDWTSALRRQIDHSIHTSGRSHPEDIAQLHKELVKLIIMALQPKSSKEVWLDLNHALGLIKPYANFLSSGHGRVGLSFQTQHYVERVFVAYHKDIAEYYDIPILESLRKVFPNELSAVEAKFARITTDGSPSPDFVISGGGYLPKRGKTPQPEKVKHEPITSIKRSLTMDLPDGRHPYTLMRRGDEPELYFRPRPLTFGDVNQSIHVVAGEAAMKESLWKDNQSATVAALQVNLLPAGPTIPIKDPKKWVPLATSSLEDDEPVKSVPTSPRKQAEFKSMTGREAVEYFMTEKHLNKVKFMYFNIAVSRHYRPYDLISVPEDKVKQEHYIFSTFGVLHVYPDGSTSETMTLADWNRMSVLWGVVSKLGFFKNFLLCKSLRHWRRTVRRQRLIRMRTYLQLNLLHTIPEFGAALLHIFRLVGELMEVKMLPNKSSGIKQLPLVSFSADASQKRNDVEHMLDVFFRYCKKVVDVTRQECFDQLKHYEYQARHMKSLFSKESLYIQRKKKQARLMNLEKARQAIRQLATFITLVDQVISVHLLQALRTSVQRFVYGVLCFQEYESEEREEGGILDDSHSTSTSPSKGLPSTYSTKGDSTTKTNVSLKSKASVFITKLVFNPKTCELEMQPSPAKFKEGICSCISTVISTVCDEAHSMNISGKPSKKDVTDQQGSDKASVDSAPSTSSERSSIDSLSSDLDGQNMYDEVDPAEDMADLNEDGSQGFGDPDLPSKKMPTKAEDSLGVATPNLVLSPEPKTRFGLMVDGEGVMGQFNPLDQSKLRNKLTNDSEILEAMKVQNNIVDDALLDVEAFCVEHNLWLVPIRKFTSKWSQKNLDEWKGKPAREIEILLNQIKAWNDQVKNMDRSILSNNRLLLVDCRCPQTDVVPVLSSIFKQLIGLVAADAKNLSLEITTSSKEAVKVLENKDLNMKSFAAYARKVTECQQMKDSMSGKVTYIRQLYEVVRMTYRQLTHEEEKLDEKVKTAWEAFVFQLKDATNFVSNQRPIILKQLDEMFQEKYSYIIKLSQQSSSGSMVDPTKSSSEVITELKNIISKFFATRRQLQDLSSCRESVEGKKYELGELDGMSKVMEDRLELWKYINISTQTIKEWKNTLFRRFDVQVALDKIQDWQRAALKLQKNLTEDDPVLQNWLKMLSDYACELPLLQIMSDEAIKSRHWKQIFTGMGESFEPGWAFTVNDLLSYKLSEHTNLINQVYHSAMAEFTLEQMLRKIKNEWENRQFHLAKHIHVITTTVQEEPKQVNTKPPGSRGSRTRDTKLNAKPLTKVVTQEKDSETYVLVGAAKLLNELSDSHVALQGMLQSRHAAEVQAEAEIWSDTLQQIGEIVNLWTSCQDKWMYLNRVFSSESHLSRRFPAQILLFENIDRKYRDYVRAMINDPKVLSVLSRRHGQKGWRELQGENLRKHILSCIQMQEELLSNISYLLEEFRSEFTRMYFLCDEDCIRLLAVARQPKKFLPYVRKCFTGVSSITYKLPSFGSIVNLMMNTLDQELHSHELQVTQIQGKNKEVIEFQSPLSIQDDATTWMKLFEEKLTVSLTTALHCIMHQRIFGEQQSPLEALEELTRSEMVFHTDDEKDETFKHWLLRYPSQVILLSDSILWSTNVDKLLKSGRKKEKYKNLIKDLCLKIKHYSNIVKDNAKPAQGNDTRGRLQSTLSSAISQAIYHRDVVQSLERDNVSDNKSFEWKRIIRHTMDIPDHEFDMKMSIKSSQFIKCFVEHMGNRVAEYGMEYDSSPTDQKTKSHPGTPFVMTPLTERSMFSLSLAMQLGKCGTLVGPTATGKSNLLKQLSRMFGRPLINLNCSEEITISVLLRSLCGMVESGSWLCFDQVHRLPIHVLSVLAQQIRHIQLAYSTLYSSTRSQYSIRGNSQKEQTTLMRSNSIPSLHCDIEETPNKTPMNQTNKWKPKISDFHLSHLSRHKEDNLYVSKFDKSNTLGSILFNGRLLQAKPNYGLFMMLTHNTSSTSYIPHNMKLLYRPIALIQPDTEKIIEVWLTASGFSNSPTLAGKISMAMKMLKGVTGNINKMPHHLSDEAGLIKIADVSLNDIRCIITMASLQRQTSPSLPQSRSDSVTSLNSSAKSSVSGSVTSSTGRRAASTNSETLLTHHNEELSIVNAIVQILSTKVNSSHATLKLKDVLRSVFPLVSRPISATELDQLLPEAINHQLQIDGLQATSEMVDKTTQLYNALKLNKAVIIVGPAGCGKTTIYKTLAQTINKISSDRRKKFLDMFQERIASSDFELKQSRDELLSSGSELQTAQSGRFSVMDSEIDEKIDLTVLFPNTLSVEDLFGYHDATTNNWNQGMIAKILKDYGILNKEDSSVGDSQEKVQKQDQVFEGLNMKAKDSLKKWIVLDGEINAPWIENMSCLLDVHKSTRLTNMDDLTLNESTNLIFEVNNFATASPAMITRCGIIHCDAMNQWQLMMTTWLDTAYGEYAITQRTIKIWKELIHELVPQTLAFLQHIGQNITNYGITYEQKVQQSSSYGVAESSSFLHLLGSLLNLHLKRDFSNREVEDGDRADIFNEPRSRLTSIAGETEISYASSNRSRLDDNVPDFNHQVAMNLFGFAFVWAFGGTLLEKDMPGFDAFFRNIMANSRHEIQFPLYESVFEYFVEEETGQFTVWEDKIDLRPHAPASGSYYAFIHPIERYAYIANTLLKSKYPVLIMGENGCGKSTMVSNILQIEHEMTRVPVCPGLTSRHLQKLIESRSSSMLKQHNLGLMAHPNAVIDTRSEGKQSILFFLDDLSCASGITSKTCGSVIQPTHELMRQVMSSGAVYERERQMTKALEGDVNFLASSSIPGNTGSGLGQSSYLISSRLTRLFTVIHFLQPSKETILSIYHNAVQSWLEEFPAYSLTRHYDLSQAIISGAVDLYASVRTHLKATPRQPHYIFSLHDISHIMQGLFLLAPRTRGRPRPMRRRGRDDGGGNIQLQRPGGGRAGGRLRARGWGDNAVGGIQPMLRTVIRLWLHECCRTFYDRLTTEDDRSWFSKSLQGTLKKHFCTDKENRMVSPGMERVKVIKTPIPSVSGSPLPSRTSTSTFGTTTTDEFASTTENEGKSGRSTQLEGFHRSEGSSFENIEGSPVGRLTEQAVSQLAGGEGDKMDDSHFSTTGTSSRMPPNLAMSPRMSEHTQEYEDNGSEDMNTDGRIAVSQMTTDESYVDSTSKSDSGSRSTSVKEGSAELAGIGESSSERNGEQSAFASTSSETLTIADDNGTEYDSRPTTNADTKTDFDEDDESRSMTTAMATELETDDSNASDNESEEGEETTSATTESRSTKSKSTQDKTLDQGKSSTSADMDALLPSSGPVPRRKSQRAAHARPGGAKLGVTFVPGLIDDPERTANTAGPLAQFHQVLSQNEDPTSILFSKNILSAVQGGAEGYSESTEGQIASALQIALAAYNGESTNPLDLVFFQQAVHHIARLSRVLSLNQGGHALCFSSTRFAGRRSLTKLAAYLCKANIFNAKAEQSNNSDKILNRRETLRRFIIEASMSAGIKNESTILLVDDDFSSDVNCIEDICALVKDGQSPSLYTHEELVNVAAEILPGTGSVRGGTSSEKLDRCLEDYFNRVLLNLHVVLLMPYSSFDGPHDLSDIMNTSRSPYFHQKEEYESLHKLLKRCPELLTRFSSVDLYEAWNHVAWMKVAENYLEEFTGISSDFGSPGGKIPIPWPSDISAVQQIVNLCHVMAFIHRDVVRRIKAISPNYANKLITPTTFRTLSELLVNISIKVGRDEKKLLRRYERVLKKIHDAEASVERYSLGKEGLLPLLEAARDTERSWKRHVEQERREYIEARQRCDLEEDIIEKLEEEVVFLKQDAKLAFDKVNPLYSSAVAAMRALTVQGLDELKRYKQPPEHAVTVVKALCDMFDVKPANWDNGKALIMQDNFYEELEFFDKDNIPENIYQALSKNVRDPEFQPAQIAKGSKAAESLCTWMHAVHSYAKLSRYLNPKIAKLKQAETKMKKAQATLGAKRVRCNQIKEELDSKIQQHKNASRAVRRYERDLIDLESKMAKAQMLMGNLAEYVLRWRHERHSTISRLESAVGDSLLTAACLTYHSVLCKEQREIALEEWKKACTHDRIDEKSGTFESSRQHSATQKHRDLHSTPSPTRQVQSTTPSGFSEADTWGDIDDESSIMTSKYRPLVIVREEFDSSNLLISEAIHREWHRGGLPRDPRIRSNIVSILASSLYQQSSWPLIFDPDNQLRLWMKTIVKNFCLMRSKEKLSIAEDEQESPYPSSGDPSSTSQSEGVDIYDDTESTMESSSHDYDDSSSAYYDDFESTVISVTSTAQTMRSGGTSRKSNKNKGVRFADEKKTEPQPTIGTTSQKESEVTPETKPVSQEDITQIEDVDKEPKTLLNIIICEADNPALKNKIVEAVQNGLILFVTNLEKASFSAAHELLLLRHQLRYRDELSTSSLGISSSSRISLSLTGTGSRKIQSHHIVYHHHVHSNFRLYLSCSVDMNFLGGHGFPNLPMHICSCVDFSLDGDGLEEKLTQIVMAQERPEFESHRRLLEADIFHLEEQKERLQSDLLLKVSGIEGPILSDPTLLDAIRDCKRETIGTDTTLAETKVMESNLLQKKIDLENVAKQGKIVYEALSQTTILKPNIYYWTANKFIHLFTSTLKSRMRGKASVNANANSTSGGSLIKSRVAELNQSVLESILRQCKKTMFKNDSLVFMTLMALSKLQQQNNMTSDEVGSLLLGVEDCKLPPSAHRVTMMNLVKPKWIKDDVWEAAKNLEQKHRQTFGGLVSSISTKQKRWQEYLHSTPVLLSNVPSDNLLHLSVGQKALLWKTLRPDIAGLIISELCSSVLGSITTETLVWNINDITAQVQQTNPVLFLIPEKGSSYQPTVEISQEAKIKKIQTIERAAPFSDDLGEVLLECMSEGHWLVLHNCELADSWPDKFLNLLYSLSAMNDVDIGFLSKNIDDNSVKGVGEEITTRSISTITTEDGDLDSERLSKQSESISMEEILTHRLPVNENFRLWLILRPTHGFYSRTIIPSVLLQNAAIINLELPCTHQGLVKLKFNQLTAGDPHPEHVLNLQSKPSRKEPPMSQEQNNTISNDNHVLKIQLSLLHAILLQRQMYDRVNVPQHTDEDILDVYKWSQTFVHDGNTDGVIPICKALLSDSITDEKKLNERKYFIEECLLSPEKVFDIRYQPRNKGIHHELQTLLRAPKKSDQGFNSLMPKADLVKLNLPNSAERSSISDNNERLLSGVKASAKFEINRAGVTEENNDYRAYNLNILTIKEMEVQQQLENILTQVQNISIPSLNEDEENMLSKSGPLYEFYHKEYARISTAVHLLKTDIQACIAASKGQIEVNPTVLNVIDAVLTNKLPTFWIEKHSEIFLFFTEYSIIKWIKYLQNIGNVLPKYERLSLTSHLSAESFTVNMIGQTRRKSSATQTLSCYNLATFMRPDMFLKSFLAEVAKNMLQDIQRLQFKVEVISKHLPASSSDLMQDSIMLEGIWLQHAVYDDRFNTIQETASDKCHKLPNVCLSVEKRPRYNRPDISSEERNIFKCPVYHHKMNQGGNILFTIPMKCDVDPLIYDVKGIHAFLAINSRGI